MVITRGSGGKVSAIANVSPGPDPVAPGAGSPPPAGAALVCATPSAHLTAGEETGARESERGPAHPAVFWILCLLKKYFSLFWV